MVLVVGVFPSISLTHEIRFCCKLRFDAAAGFHKVSSHPRHVLKHRVQPFRAQDHQSEGNHEE